MDRTLSYILSAFGIDRSAPKGAVAVAELRLGLGVQSLAVK